MLLKTERLTIRRIVEADWKDLLAIWMDFSLSESLYRFTKTPTEMT